MIAPPPFNAAGRNPTGSILVVDDEELLRLTLRLTCESLGHRVQTASDGKQALEVVKHTKPDLVILDYRLPDTTGVDLAHELVRLHPACQGILCSAHIDDDMVRRLLPVGFIDFLSKPILPDTVREVVQLHFDCIPDDSNPGCQLLHHWRRHQHQDSREEALRLCKCPETASVGQTWVKIIDQATNDHPDAMSKDLPPLSQLLFQ